MLDPRAIVGVATLIGLLAASCSTDPTFVGATGAGGASGGGGPGTTGTGEGGDASASGSTGPGGGSCADPDETCAPTAPPGWTGPIAMYRGPSAEPKPFC